MRIIAGKFRGRKLKVIRSPQFRPTSEVAREALFNILRDKVVDASFLDVCAGSGSVGLEALSRGAAKVTFIERNPICVAALQRNISMFGCQKQVKVICSDAIAAMRRLLKTGEKFDIIFADPPYGTDLANRLLKWLDENSGLLDEDGLFIVQHSRRDSLSCACSSLELLRSHSIGETVFSFYARKRSIR
jgi:16S rRNA (guanine(966)-N(2))-methyltransferase RsmD